MRLLIPLLLLLSGCAHQREAAAKELGCPTESVRVTPLAEGVRAVEGCGVQAIYIHTDQGWIPGDAGTRRGYPWPSLSSAREAAASGLSCPVEQVTVDARQLPVEAHGCGRSAYLVGSDQWTVTQDAPPDEQGAAVLARAQQDLDCDRAGLKLTGRQGRRWVEGCGKRAGYQVICDGEVLPLEDAVLALREAPPKPAPPPTTGPLPFGEGMTRPTRVCGFEPMYTSEAAVERLQGLLILKCSVETSGIVTRCQVLKDLPGLRDAALDVIYGWRMRPATFKGNPVAVEYVFNIKFARPSGG